MPNNCKVHLPFGAMPCYLLNISLLALLASSAAAASATYEVNILTGKLDGAAPCRVNQFLQCDIQSFDALAFLDTQVVQFSTLRKVAGTTTVFSARTKPVTVIVPDIPTVVRIGLFYTSTTTLDYPFELTAVRISRAKLQLVKVMVPTSFGGGDRWLLVNLECISGSCLPPTTTTTTTTPTAALLSTTALTLPAAATPAPTASASPESTAFLTSTSSALVASVPSLAASGGSSSKQLDPTVVVLGVALGATIVVMLVLVILQRRLRRSVQVGNTSDPLAEAYCNPVYQDWHEQPFPVIYDNEQAGASEPQVYASICDAVVEGRLTSVEA